VEFPVLLCKRDTLAVVRPDFFERVGQLDEASGQLALNVTADGKAWLQWIVDHDGWLFRLTTQGLAPTSAWQALGLRRRRERFRIEPAVRVTAGELSELIAGLQDSSPEVPNVSDLRALLSKLPSGQTLTKAHLREYFGE